MYKTMLLLFIIMNDLLSSLQDMYRRGWKEESFLYAKARIMMKYFAKLLAVCLSSSQVQLENIKGGFLCGCKVGVKLF